MVKQGKKGINNKKSFLIITISSIVVFLFLLGLVIYKYIVNNNIDVARNEVTALIFVVLIYVLYVAVVKKKWIPDFLLVKNVSFRENDKSFRIKTYLVKSLIFANLFSLLDIIARLFVSDYESLFIFNSLNEIFNILLNLLIIFIGSFVISFCLELFIEKIEMIRNKKYDRRV